MEERRPQKVIKFIIHFRQWLIDDTVIDIRTDWSKIRFLGQIIRNKLAADLKKGTIPRCILRWNAIKDRRTLGR